MQDYNLRMVPILAPCGFPSSLALPNVDSAFFVPAIQALQRELGLKDDGQCGPRTIRAIAAREYSRCMADDCEAGWVIIGPRVVMTGVKTRTYLDSEYSWLGETKSSPRTKALRLGVIHYDVTNSSAQTHRVLLKRALSTHFMVDEDGTLYQCHDPITSVCIHAGSRTNKVALGVDLNSPALRAFERSSRPRPELEVEVQGRKMRMLAYWPEQIEALEALMAAMEEGAGLPRVCPRDKNGMPITEVFPGWLQHKGWIGHYHITRKKIDPAPLDWDVVCPKES